MHNKKRERDKVDSMTNLQSSWMTDCIPTYTEFQRTVWMDWLYGFFGPGLAGY